GVVLDRERLDPSSTGSVGETYCPVGGQRVRTARKMHFGRRADARVRVQTRSHDPMKRMTVLALALASMIALPAASLSAQATKPAATSKPAKTSGEPQAAKP